MGERALTVAVLGASGFLGGWVCAAFADAGWSVRAASRRHVALLPGSEVVDGAASRVRPVVGDLRAPGAVGRACRGADVVVVLVTDTTSTGTWRIDDDDARSVVVGIPSAVAAHVRGRDTVPTVLYAGSVTQPREGGSPASRYDLLKQEAEDVLLGLGRDGAVCVTSLRLSTVYGPARSVTGADRGVVSTMVRHALRDEALTLWHDGSPLRDVLFAADAAQAFVRAATRSAALCGYAWDVGSDRQVSVGDLFATVAERVSEVTGRPAVAVVRGRPPAFASALDHRDVTADGGPFRLRTGWRPRTSWRDGVHRTVNHLLAEARCDERRA